MPKKRDLLIGEIEEMAPESQAEPVSVPIIKTTDIISLEQMIGDKSILPRAMAASIYHNDEYFNNLTKLQEVGELLNSKEFQNAIGKGKAKAYTKTFDSLDKALFEESTGFSVVSIPRSNVSENISSSSTQERPVESSNIDRQNKLMNKYFIKLLDDYDKFIEKNSKPKSEKSWVEKLTDRIKEKTPEKTDAKMKAYEKIVKIIGEVREPIANKILREKNSGLQISAEELRSRNGSLS